MDCSLPHVGNGWDVWAFVRSVLRAIPVLEGLRHDSMSLDRPSSSAMKLLPIVGVTLAADA